VATVSTSDPFGAGALAAFQNASAALNISIRANAVLESTDGGHIDAALRQLQAAQARIIAVFATERDAKPVFEAAHRAGMLGDKRYMFLGGNGLGDALLAGDWALLRDDPAALQGITTVSGGACQPDTDHYRRLAAYANATQGVELDMFTCLAYDSAAMLLMALGDTLRAWQGSPACLSSAALQQDPACMLKTADAAAIWAEAGCNGTCVMCGVCELMRVEDGAYYRSPQAMLLRNMYR
jgi:ABC-type branched-subunit amino acid transport system substrate-binding protein